MNLLVTGAWAEATSYFDRMEALGHRAVFLREEKDPLPLDPVWVEGAVCNGLFLHHPLEAFPNLRYIQLTSAGLDRLPMEAVRARGIRVRNARGVYSGPMAEMALSGVLQLYKQTRFFLDRQRSHSWEKHRGLLELAGRTVTILGCGSVGDACAKRFRALECRILGVDLCPSEGPDYDALYPLAALDRALAQTDILVLTLPLTEESRHMIDAARLSLLKPGAVVVNISRGPIVEQDALCAALRDGRLGGAVLDVFETEPLCPDSPLWDMEQVILTPHNSFVGDGNAARLSRLILAGLEEEASRPDAR